MVGTLLLVLAGLGGADDIVLPLEESQPGWNWVTVVEDGVEGSAASFANPLAYVDVGSCPVTSEDPFTLRASLRTTFAGFMTVLMSREDYPVALSLVMGRHPGRISFEAWSWQQVKLISQSRVDDGEWHTIEVSYDPASNHAVMFVDGVLEAWGLLGLGGAPAARLRLGNNIGANQPFRGDLDEVSILRRTSRPELFAGLGTILSEDERAADLADLRTRLLPRETPITDDLEHWDVRRAEVRAGVADALGLVPEPPRGPTEPKILGGLQGDGFTLQRISWNSWSDYPGYGWLWLPDPMPVRRLPAVLCPHGHWRNGALDPVVQARCAHLARTGHVVLTVDSVHVEDVASGLNSIGVMTWNNIRAIDLLLDRDDVDPTRIGVTGASGGAQQTMYLMALDDRIAAAAPICMISYYAEIIDDRSAHHECNHPPRVGHLTDGPEMCAVFAPRPVAFGSVTGDWTMNFPEEGLPEITKIYEHLDRADGVQALHLEAEHNYDQPMREFVYTFFDAQFSDGSEPVEELSFRAIPIPRIMELIRVPIPPIDRAAMAREFARRRPRVESLQVLAPGLPWRVDQGVVEEAENVDESSPWRGFTVKSSDGVRIPFIVRETGDADDAPYVLVLHPEGRAAMILEPPSWLEDISSPVLADPRFAGDWRPFQAAWRRNGLLLGRGEAYQAAHDSALIAASLPGDRPVTIVGLGSSGVTALLAATLSPRITRVIVPDIGPRFAQDGNRLPLTPEILRFGDLPELVAAIPGLREIFIGGADVPDDYHMVDGIELHVAESPLDDAAIRAALADQ